MKIPCYHKVGFTRHKLTYKVEVWLYDLLENKACFGKA